VHVWYKNERITVNKKIPGITSLLSAPYRSALTLPTY
jgi:hypothetical protein